MAQIKSKYFKITQEQLDSTLFYLRDVHTKFDAAGETTQFTTLNILDTDQSVSLGGDVLRKDKNGNVTLRIKLTYQDGVVNGHDVPNEAIRMYQVYDSKQNQVISNITAEQVCNLLTQAGIVESEPLTYNKIEHIKSI